MAVPSDKHLLAFGRLMVNFAHCELGIKFVIGGMMRTGIDEALIALEPYSATNVRNVARSLAKETLKPEICERLVQIVGDWFKHNALRNLIAHSRWTNAERPGAVKPLGVSIREGKAKWLGMPHIDDGSEGYTSDEIDASAQDLAAISERLRTFILSTGISPTMEKATDEISASMSHSSGMEGSSGSK
jgi:hypothetical protein